MLSRVLRGAGALTALLLSSACAAPDVEMRTSAPPWDAPQPAVHYIQEAGLPVHEVEGHEAVVQLHGPGAPTFAKFFVFVDGQQVPVPSGIGLDSKAELMSSLHTHEDDGVVTVELREGEEQPTIADFFELWGVRFDERCLGDTCGTVEVLVNSERADWDDEIPRDGMVEVRVAS